MKNILFNLLIIYDIIIICYQRYYYIECSTFFRERNCLKCIIHKRLTNQVAATCVFEVFFSKHHTRVYIIPINSMREKCKIKYYTFNSRIYTYSCHTWRLLKCGRVSLKRAKERDSSSSPRYTLAGILAVRDQ